MMKLRVKSAKPDGGKLPYLLSLDDLPGNFLHQVNKIGDTFEVDDKIGYKLMDMYGDFLEIATGEVKQVDAPRNRMLKEESVK